MLLDDQKLFNPAGRNWQEMAAYFANSRSGPPAPIKFLGSRPTFEAFGKALDGGLAARYTMPVNVSAFLDVGFKTAYPTVAETRNRQRQIFFDIFYETMRCSARAYTDPSVVAKVKGGQPVAEQKLADIGQKFHELLTKHDDVPPDVKERIKELVDKTPAMKKKFDESAATTPVPKS